MTTSGKLQQITMPYGAASLFTCELDASQVLGYAHPPEANPTFREDLHRALAGPLDFPPLHRAILDQDRVVLALDYDTPRASQIIAELWEVFEKCDVQPANVLILQPPQAAELRSDPRVDLPVPLRNEVGWKIHDPDDAQACGYLASTSNGIRVYLARDILEADIVISVGRTAFDPVLGFRGTSSVFYPGLSNRDAIQRAYGQGHSELTPEHDRPLRQVIDEVAWLLGSQFTVQVLQSAGGDVSRVLAGATESVFRHARHELSRQNSLQLDFRADLVIVAVDADPGGHGWRQVGAAVETGRRLVSHGGRIVILSEIREMPGPGLQMLQRSESPADVLQRLRQEQPDDLIAATQVANAADWANLYLLSALDVELVEDLFAFPLSDIEQVHRLIARADTCAFVGSAQNMFAGIGT